MNEQWKPVLGYEANYKISNLGKIQSRHSGKWVFLKGALSHYGYWRINLFRNQKRKFTLIHRLVAQAFIPNPKKLPFINHKDGNRQNNYISNLEWCTCAENTRQGKLCKLKPSDVREIRELSKTLTQPQIAKKFKISRSHVSDIILYKKWKI